MAIVCSAFENQAEGRKHGQHLQECGKGLPRGAVITIEAVEPLVRMIQHVECFKGQSRLPSVLSPDLVYTKIRTLVIRQTYLIPVRGEEVSSVWTRLKEAWDR